MEFTTISNPITVNGTTTPGAGIVWSAAAKQCPGIMINGKCIKPKAVRTAKPRPAYLCLGTCPVATPVNVAKR